MNAFRRFRKSSFRKTRFKSARWSPQPSIRSHFNAQLTAPSEKRNGSPPPKPCGRTCQKDRTVGGRFYSLESTSSLRTLWTLVPLQDEPVPSPSSGCTRPAPLSRVPRTLCFRLLRTLFYRLPWTRLHRSYPPGLIGCAGHAPPLFALDSPLCGVPGIHSSVGCTRRACSGFIGHLSTSAGTNLGV